VIDRREPLATGPVESDLALPPPAPATPGPALRRWISPRRAWTAAAGLGVLTAGLWWALLRVRDWYHHLPENQIAFADIQLVPEPPPWIRAGREGLLERVRLDGGWDRVVSPLSIDKTKLLNDFRLSPWVEDVPKVDGSRPGRLAIHLRYREPVARVALDAATVYLDGDGVVLPDDLGVVGDPLIPILNLHSLVEARPGRKLKVGDPSGGAGRSEVPTAAARLAAFVRRHQRATPPPRFPVRSIVLTENEKDGRHWLWLIIGEKVRVGWGAATTPDAAREPSDDEKWGRLLDWAPRAGPVRLDDPDTEYLVFDIVEGRVTGLTVRRGPPSPR
jgi:hypothetical protein